MVWDKINNRRFFKKNSKGRAPSTDLGWSADEKLTINSNLFVTKLVG